MSIVIGLRVGQRRQTSALCVVEKVERPDQPWLRAPKTEKHFLVRHLERLPAGTRFPEIAERAAQVVDTLRRDGHTYPRIYLDATGYGQPLIDLVKSAVSSARAVAVYFTWGDRRIEEGQDVIRLGKALLVTELQMLLQTGRLHLPRTDEAQVLADELMSYEIRVEADANDRYGAFPVGSRDELVTALGMAVQNIREYRACAVRSLW